MDDLSGAIGYQDVLLAVVLVGLGGVLSRLRRVGLERDIAVATLRSSAQLLAVGYVLTYVFEGHGALTVVVLGVMVVTATLTSGSRARHVPGARAIAALSLMASTSGNFGVLAGLGIVPLEPRTIVLLVSIVRVQVINTDSL